MAIDASYALLSRVGYRADVAKIGHPTPTSTDDKLDYPDLLITRTNGSVDYKRMHTNCLLTINGIIQPTVYDDGNLYIPNATDKLIVSRNTHIGMISFYNHPRIINKHFIDSGMISGRSNTPLYERVYVTFPLESGVGNFVFILAGYMLFEESDFIFRSSHNKVCICPKRLNIKRKIIELSRYTNIFKDIGLEDHTHTNLLNEDDITDEVIIKLLTLPNTFLMNFSGGSISGERKYVEYTSIPGLARTEHDVTLPLRSSDGRFLEYSKQKGAGNKYNLSIADPYYSNYIFSQLSEMDTSVINAARDPNYKQMLLSAYFLRITVT